MIIVLLNVDWIYARPIGTDFRARRLVRVFLGMIEPLLLRAGLYIYYFVTVCLRPATVLRCPRFVRALVRVRWPLTGSPRRWRIPR